MKNTDSIINNILSNVKKKLEFMKLADSDILGVVKKNFSNYNGDINSIVFDVVKYYYDIIFDVINHNDLTYLYKYIEYYNDNENIVENLCRFLFELNVELNFDMCEKLLGSSQILFNSMSNMVNLAIHKNRLEDLLTNDIIKDIVEVYCILNNIQIYNDEFDDKDCDTSYCGNSFVSYLRDIGRIPRLSEDEERELLSKNDEYDEISVLYDELIEIYPNNDYYSCSKILVDI